MNIEIANRLVELRKKNGLSQEELADKLGLSRQAVSKWERAESSPDTDNLICLAKLYNVSLDDLLKTDQDIEEITEEVREKENNIIIVEEQKKQEEKKRYKKFRIIENAIGSSLFILALATYIIVSAFFPEQWGKLWVVFLVPVFLSSIATCVKKRRFAPFAYPVLATFVFLTIGVYAGVWHPTWIAFITIPVFYAVTGPIDEAVAKTRNEKLDPKDYEELD